MFEEPLSGVDLQYILHDVKSVKIVRLNQKLLQKGIVSACHKAQM